MNAKHSAFNFACVLAFGIVACGSSDSGDGSGGAGGSGGGGAGTAGGAAVTCADLAACCSSASFTEAAAQPDARIRLSMCQEIATQDSQPACSALYHGYQASKVCL